MIKIIFYLITIQYCLILGIYLFKMVYLKSKFNDYMNQELFTSNRQEHLSINDSSPIKTSSVFIPLLGLFKIPAWFILVLDEINSYKKTEHYWDTIKRDDLFVQTRNEFNRLQLKTDCLLI